MGSQGSRKRRQRRPPPEGDDEDSGLRVAGTPNEYDAISPLAGISAAGAIARWLRRWRAGRRRS